MCLEPNLLEVDRIIKKNPQKFFYVTRIGCGIAGFKDEQIAPLFKNALELENVCLPKSFVQVLKEEGPY